MPAESGNFFVVIEGLDGSGKTEIGRRLMQVLRQSEGERVKMTFEPHDPSCAGLFVRQVLMKKIATGMPQTLALAFAANRADHSDRVIEPFLSGGEKRMVICDRYYLSSLVYQSSGGLSMKAVMALSSAVRQPHLTIFLNASTETCYERMSNRPADKELFERNLEETRQKYLDAIEFLRSERGETIVEVQADGSIPEVLAEVLDVLGGEHGPDWLEVKRPVDVDSLPEMFSFGGEAQLKIEDVVAGIGGHWTAEEIEDAGHLRETLEELREVVIAEVGGMSFDEVGSLFVDYLMRLGYRVGSSLPWTDMDGFELEHDLPGGLKLRGAALLLGEEHRYELITRSVIEAGELAGFMLVFDPGTAEIVEYYEREMVQGVDGETALSPATRIVGRDDLARFALAVALARYYERYPSDEELREAVDDAVNDWGLGIYWERATSSSP